LWVLYRIVRGWMGAIRVEANVAVARRLCLQCRAAIGRRRLRSHQAQVLEAQEQFVAGPGICGDARDPRRGELWRGPVRGLGFGNPESQEKGALRFR
jgi:hypothetical protein